MPSLLVGPILERLHTGKRIETALPKCLDKVIARIAVADELIIDFEDGPSVTVQDNGQSCCEHRYMHTDDDLAYYHGAHLLDVELEDGPSVEDECGNTKDSMFLIVTTSKGKFTVVSYNEHNGYYGGFSIKDSF